MKIRCLRLTYIILALLTINFLSCGTLGGFDNITFHVTKRNLVSAIDTLYSRKPKLPHSCKMGKI